MPAGSFFTGVSGVGDPLSTGAKDRPVRIEQLVETTDESGFPIESWETLAARVWAHRQDRSGGERMAGARLSAQVDSSWIIHYRSDMDPEQLEIPKRRRLIAYNRIYDIVAAQVVGLHEGIHLMTLLVDQGTPTP